LNPSAGQTVAIIPNAKPITNAAELNARLEAFRGKGIKVRDFSFIHAAEDVPHVLSVAAEAGLTIRDGDPTSDPGPIIVDQTRFSDKDSGQFIGYRDEWIFGKLSTHLVQGGAYQGKYDIAPGTNCTGIDFYFLGERELGRKRRLGNGTISRRVDWYSPEQHQVYPSPPDVKLIFDAICKRLDIGKRIREGGRTYYVLDGALKKIGKGYLPPFDFIEWPTELR
jgi:hypothetical protein